MNVVEKWMVNRSTTGKSGQKLAKKLLTHINTDPSQRFLDIGCGQGVITRYLAINYPGEFTGIDLDELEIEAARAKPKLKNLSYQVGDARALPFEERSFDVVMALGVLHHIPDWYKAVSEIGRILKVGGYFISAELVYPQWVTSMDEKSSFKFGIYDLDIARLVRMIQDEGFITLHNEENKRLLWKDFQAVFEKKYEKAFSRV